MSASAFEAALEEIGVSCTVEERGRLAILTLRPPTDPSTTDPSLALVMTDGAALGMPGGAARRQALVAIGRVHGYSNVCVELDAAVSGD
jgi:hypothetical protein